MRCKFVCYVKEIKSRVSITIDKSTIHGIPYIIIYIRCDVSGKGDVDNVFLDLVELQDGVDTESIFNSMMASLHKAEMDDDFLRTHLICIATNGAVVLTVGLLLDSRKSFRTCSLFIVCRTDQSWLSKMCLKKWVALINLRLLFYTYSTISCQIT